MKSYATPIKYGIVAGIIMVAMMLLIYMVAVAKLATFFTLIVYLPLIFCMIWGGITYRKEIGGYRTFGQAFVAVLIISIIGTTMLDVFVYILSTVIDPDLPELLKKMTIENTELWMEKLGAPDDDVREAIKKMKDEDPTPTFKAELQRVGVSLFIGAVFSALIALFVRRDDRQTVIKAEE